MSIKTMQEQKLENANQPDFLTAETEKPLPELPEEIKQEYIERVKKTVAVFFQEIEDDLKTQPDVIQAPALVELAAAISVRRDQVADKHNLNLAEMTENRRAYWEERLCNKMAK